MSVFDMAEAQRDLGRAQDAHMTTQQHHVTLPLRAPTKAHTHTHVHVLVPRAGKRLSAMLDRQRCQLQHQDSQPLLTGAGADGRRGEGGENTRGCAWFTSTAVTLDSVRGQGSGGMHCTVRCVDSSQGPQRSCEGASRGSREPIRAVVTHLGSTAVGVNAGGPSYLSL